MGLSVFPAASSGMTTTRFPCTIGAPFNIPAGLTLQNTVTSTTTFSAGALPAQVWAVVVGAGGSGSSAGTSVFYSSGGGGGGVAIGWVDVPSAGITATIGAGGAGVYNPGGSTGLPGNQGGNTAFGGVIAYGGGRGADPAYGGAHNSSNPWVRKGPGAGDGGPGNHWFGSGTYQTIPSGSIWYMPPGSIFPNGFVSVAFPSATAGLGSLSSTTSTVLNNYAGGGSGAATGSISAYAGNGLTGGGGSGSYILANAGGHSSTNGGLTIRFAGGTSATDGPTGGAGFLAAGVNSPTYGGTAGGSGGGGGSGTANSAYNTSGAGGNGCVLIYY